MTYFDESKFHSYIQNYDNFPTLKWAIYIFKIDLIMIFQNWS